LTMKILQVVHSFIPYTKAGTEVYAYSLSKELARRHEVSVFFRIRNFKKREYSVEYNDFQGLKTFAVNQTFNQCRSFRETYDNKHIDKIFADLLDKVKPDIVHIHHLLFLSFGIIKEVKKRNIPVVFTLHDYWIFCHKGQLIRDDLTLCATPDFQNCKACLRSQLSIKGNSMRYYNFLRKRVPNIILHTVKKSYLGLAGFDEGDFERMLQERDAYAKEISGQVDVFVSPSQFLKEKFIAFGIPREKILYSPYGIDHDNFKRLEKAKSGVIKFAFIGILLPMKGVDMLIEAFRRIPNKNAELLIFGKPYPYAGYEGYCALLKKNAAADSRIKFRGEFDNAKIAEVFAQFDVLVVPSIWLENAPLVIQEALLAKTPVLASRIGGIPELIEDGKNGLLFNPSDVNDLRKKLQYLIDNPSKIELLGAYNSQVKDISENAKEIEEIYSRVRSSS